MRVVDYLSNAQKAAGKTREMLEYDRAAALAVLTGGDGMDRGSHDEFLQKGGGSDISVNHH